MINLSVVIITLNEEKNISRCIDSVKKVADEVILVDSFSTDKTREIAISKGAIVISNVFEGHIEQKNYALSQCSYNYVLSLDADEELSEKLIQSILEIKKGWSYDGYYMNRLSSYCGKWIRNGGWYPDKKLRLFKKDKGKWGGTNPHDKLILEQGATFTNIKGDILHYTFHTIAEHIKQANYFTDIGALQEYKRGKDATFIKIFLGPLFQFFKGYFLRLGLLDGYYGFVISIISSHANFLKYIKLRELNKQK